MLFGRSLFVTSFVHWLSHSSIRLFIARLFQQAFQSLIFPLVRPFIYPSISSSICVFIHQSADPSIHPFIRPLIHPSPSIHSSIPLSVHPATHSSPHPSTHRSICSSVRPSFHHFTHPSKASIYPSFLSLLLSFLPSISRLRLRSLWPFIPSPLLHSVHTGREFLIRQTSVGLHESFSGLVCLSLHPLSTYRSIDHPFILPSIVPALCLALGSEVNGCGTGH